MAYIGAAARVAARETHQQAAQLRAHGGRAVANRERRRAAAERQPPTLNRRALNRHALVGPAPRPRASRRRGLG